MKYLRLYDLKNEKVTVIPYTRYKRHSYLELEKIRKRKRNRIIFRWIRDKIIVVGIALIKISISIASGLLFMTKISKWLLEVRGYEAIGSEIIAAGMISALVFILLDQFFNRKGWYL